MQTNYSEEKTKNQKLVSWVEKMAELCQPDAVHWCDGSKAEYDDIKSGSDGAGEVQTTENTVNTALQPWVYERFEPYMTEECFDRFIASAEYDIPYMAYIHVVDMEVTDFEMTVTDDGYDFTAKVVLKSFGNPINKDISGSAQLDENGKLEYFKVRGEEDVTVYFALSSQLRFD